MARGLQISDAEWAVMEPIWAAGACTAALILLCEDETREQLGSRALGALALLHLLS